MRACLNARHVTRSYIAAVTSRQLETAMLDLLRERGTATACPSEVARAVGGTGWRSQMTAVRAVAAALQARGLVEAYQHGRPVEVASARGPIRLRSSAVRSIDYRAEPERYVIGRGEQGVLTVEPYKSELLPLWTFKTPAAARTSARALYRAFVAYGRAGDFVGMDMARKFLQMGWTRARRYANHASGTKYAANRAVLARSPDPVKAEAAEVFRTYYDRARANRTYTRLGVAFRSGRAGPRRPRHTRSRSSAPSRGRGRGSTRDRASGTASGARRSRRSSYRSSS